ncbi:MAG: alanine and proline-rich secreted protein Apa [Planctomycetes bacterium]|nr:alanine and proline-rich secreted protein Apa [Planctomycetota bacterium]
MRLGLFLFLCLLAVGGGLGWGVWEYQQQNHVDTKQIVDGLKGPGSTGGVTSQKPPDSGTKPPDDGHSSTSVKPPDSGTKPPVTPVKPPDSTEIKSTDAALVAIVEEGTRLYRAANYAAAKRKFLQALSGTLRPDDRGRIEVLQKNSTLFQSLVEQVNPADILPVDNRATVYLENGGIIAGVLEKEGSDYVEIRKDNGILAHFSSIQVQRVEKLSKAEVLAALEKEYQSKVEGMGPKPMGLDYYELAVFCIKNELNERVTDLLESAVKLDRNVLQAATETKARMVYGLYTYFLKKGNADAAETKRRELIAKYPESRFAKMVGGVVARADPPKNPVDPPKNPVDPPKNPVDPPKNPVDPPKNPVDPPKNPVDPTDSGGDHGNPVDPNAPAPKFSNPKVQALVDKANKAYDEGMAHLEKSFDDKNSDRDGENMKALKAFKDACTSYEAAAEIDADNAWLNERLRQAGENRVMCFIAAKKR